MRVKHFFLAILINIFLLGACNRDKIKKSSSRQDVSCEEKIDHFSFPEILDSAILTGYVCNSYKIPDTFFNGELGGAAFQDLNYAVYNYHSANSKIVFDRESNLLFCVKKFSNEALFSGNVNSIMLLGGSLLPVFSISRGGIGVPGENDTIYFEKFCYDDSLPQLYSRELIFPEAKHDKFIHITFEDILFYSKEFKKGNFRFTGRIFSYTFERYKKVPVWKELD